MAAEPGSCDRLLAVSAKSAPPLRAAYMESMRSFTFCRSASVAFWPTYRNMCAGRTSPRGPMALLVLSYTLRASASMSASPTNVGLICWSRYCANSVLNEAMVSSLASSAAATLSL